MSASTLLLLVTVALNGLAAMLACLALFLWVGARMMGQPISFREAFRGTGLAAAALGGLGLAGLLLWVVLQRFW